MLQTDPLVSVVVPTRDRPRWCTRLLQALADQSDAPAYEVVVVVDGPDPVTEALVLKAATEASPVRLVRRSTSGGPAAARNDGWRRARGRVIAFVDDDCLPSPGWLAALTTPVLSGVADVVQGRTDPLGDPLPQDRWTRTIRIVEASGRYETCNIAYRRDLLEALDGFDETLTRAGEDADLGLRAMASGAQFRFTPTAVVAHERLSQTFDELLASRARAQDLAGLVRRHPAFRGQLVSGVFWDKRHRAAWTAAFVVVLAPRSRLLGPALALAEVARRTRHFRDATHLEKLRLASGSLLADGWELVHTVHGAVRWRTLVL